MSKGGPDPLGSLSDPYWARQAAAPDPYDEQFNDGVREITVREIQRTS